MNSTSACSFPLNTLVICTHKQHYNPEVEGKISVVNKTKRTGCIIQIELFPKEIQQEYTNTMAALSDLVAFSKAPPLSYLFNEAALINLREDLNKTN